MAESRVRIVSLLVFATVAAVAGMLFVAAGDLPTGEGTPLWLLAAWALAVAAAHLLTVPAPTGGRIRLGIGPLATAALTLDEPIALAAVAAGGMTLAWLAMRIQARRTGEPVADAEFLIEALAMGAFVVVVPGATNLAVGLPRDWAGLLIIGTAGVVWFLIRAALAALVALDRKGVSPRYLWLLALEDWPAAASLLAAGAIVGLAWPIMGAWSLSVSVLPYALSHVAFSQYRSTRVTYAQMIRALAQVPEAAELAPEGHSLRTTELALDIARDVGLHPKEVDQLEFAALLHDVGRISLSEPTVLQVGYTDEDIARWGSQIIAEAPYLRHVAEVIERQHRPYRTPGVDRDPEVPRASMVIKVASAYDQGVHELGLSPGESLERIHQAIAYEFDPVIVASLRRILTHRGLI